MRLVNMTKIRYAGRTLFFFLFLVAWALNQLLAASPPHLQAQPWLVSKPISQREYINSSYWKLSHSHKIISNMSEEFYLYLGTPSFPQSHCIYTKSLPLSLAHTVLIQSWEFGFRFSDSLERLPEGLVLFLIPSVADHLTSDTPCPLYFNASPNLLG